MFKVRDEYIGDGSTTAFGVTFPFMSESHVYAEVEGTPVPITFIAPALVQITPAPAAGSAVLLYRDTDIDELNYEFQLGAAFLPPYIDSNNKQLLYSAQESADSAATAVENSEIAVSTAAQAAGDSANAVLVSSQAAQDASTAVLVADAALDTANAAEATANGIAGTAATALSTAVAADAKAEAALEAVGEAGVASFAGRSGVVLPQSGDYAASMVARGVSTVDADLSAVEAAVATLDQTKVEQTSSTGAAKLPTGSTAQRPAPESGLVRFNSDTQEFEGYNGEEWSALGSSDAGVPLFAVTWWANRATIPGGYVAADGQTLSRATYPDAWAGVQAGNVPTVADTVWLSTPTERGKFTAGDGNTTFRLPDYNGKAAGSLGAVFLRGDGALSAAVPGAIQLDEIKAHNHYEAARINLDMDIAGGYDALGKTEGIPTTQTYQRAGIAESTTHGNTSTTGGSETRPLNVTGCWVVKLYGEVVNTGAADAAQLASDYANLASDYANLAATVQSLAGEIDFTVVYPNGGTPLAPAEITKATLYVEPNPFPGYMVICQAQVRINGLWQSVEFATSGANGYGVRAGLAGSGNIEVFTGNTGLYRTDVTYLGHCSGPRGVANQTTLPCRVLVWKVRGDQYA